MSRSNSVGAGGSATAPQGVEHAGRQRWARRCRPAALTRLAAPGIPRPTDGAVVGTPVRVDWEFDVLEGQRLPGRGSSNANAVTKVSEDFEAGNANRQFSTNGDKSWSISDAVARSGSKSFNVNGLGRGQQSRLELTETITEPTEVSFSYRGGRGGEPPLS